MAYESRVYRILIASPSDVEEEREIAVRVIQEWNDLHSYSRKVVLLPLRWETHTAPQYGTRPQEVINRAIVDQCDLLIGIFWTRLGSPTGEADSGTLEEIERVGKAGKPIMLYFSKVAIDPDRLDLKQVEQLHRFKEQTYPNSLTESYKSVIEFRDKFAKQLELKIRELQKEQDSGPPPLSLCFLDLETGELLGDSLSTTLTVPVVTDLAGLVKGEANEVRQATIQTLVDHRIKEAVAVPVLLAIRNTSSAGVRDLYVEMVIRANNRHADVSEAIGSGVESRFYTYLSQLRDIQWEAEGVPSLLEGKVKKKIADLEQSGLRRGDDDFWRFSFEWGAIQPQRFRLVKPIVFVTTQEPASVLFAATVFADGFPQPVTLKATLNVDVEKSDVTIDQLVPDLETILAKISDRAERQKGVYNLSLGHRTFSPIVLGEEKDE